MRTSEATRNAFECVLEAVPGERVLIVCDSEKAEIGRAFATDKWAKVVGEYAFGINPKATSLTEFLETEKINRTIHVAFGNNLDMPRGRNPSANHMDFLISDPTVKITKENGKAFTVMEDGKYKPG